METVNSLTEQEVTPIEKEQKLPFEKKILYFIGALFISLLIRHLKRKSAEISTLKKKVKYFKPTLHESSWGSKSISWEMRDTPLSDKEVDDFLNGK